MCEHDGRRHELRRFVAGVAEHQALIASALFGGVLPSAARASTPCSISGDCSVICCRSAICVGVKNVNRHSRNRCSRMVSRTSCSTVKLAKAFDSWNGNFATDNDEVAFGERLASDATSRILLEAGIENGILKWCRKLCRDDLR